MAVHGLHNRGLFANTLRANGVSLRIAAFEAPHKIGRIEVHSGIFKKAFHDPAKKHHLVGNT